MIKKLTVMLLLGSLFFIANCPGGGAFGDVREVINQQTAATEKLVDGLKNANNAKDIANAYKDYNDVMEKLAPKYKEFAQKYPDMEDTMPADLAADVDKLEKISHKLGELSSKASEYLTDPDVSKEMQRTLEIMSTMM
jgi:DNA repair ATPase RecN